MVARLFVVAVLLLATLALVCLPACATGSGGSRGALSPAGDWALAAMEGEPLPHQLPRGVNRPTLSLGEDGRLSGMAGVNRYTGGLDPASWLGGNFEPGPIATTRMAGPPEAMDFEQRFLSLLSRVDSFSIEDGALLLREGGDALLRFVRAGTAG